MMRQARLCLLAWLLCACGGSTGGSPITMAFHVGGVARDAAAPFVFTNDTGWNVTLLQAQAVLGPFYFNVDPPDPNVLNSGVFLVQALQQVVIDTLDPNLQALPGGAAGESGSVTVAQIGLYTNAYAYNANLMLTPPLSCAAAGGTAFVSGTATKNATTVNFAGLVMIDQALITATTFIDELANVQGISAPLSFSSRPGTLVLRVDPTHWFDGAQFDTLVPITTGVAQCMNVSPSVLTWGDSDAMNRALLAGMNNATQVYLFTQE